MQRPTLIVRTVTQQRQVVEVVNECKVPCIRRGNFLPSESKPRIHLTLSVASFIHSSKLVFMTSMLTGMATGATALRRFALRAAWGWLAEPAACPLRCADGDAVFSLPRSAAKCADLRRAARSAASSFILFILRLGLNGDDSEDGDRMVACFLLGTPRLTGVDGDAVGVGMGAKCGERCDDDGALRPVVVVVNTTGAAAFLPWWGELYVKA